MINTIPAIFRETVAAFSTKDAILFKQSGRYCPISYREFHEHVGHLASALIELGIEPGDRVAILSENRPEWLIADQAILSLGAVVVPIYPTLIADQITYLLEDAGVKAAFCSTAGQVSKIQQASERVSSLEFLVQFEGEIASKRAESRVKAFSDVVAHGAEAAERTERERAERASRITPQWLASIVYTSGTTGEPKGAMLSHGNFVSNALATLEIIDVDYQDVALSFLPLCHVYERIAYYVAISRGITIAFAESIETVGQNVREVQPTYMAAVPRVLEKVHSRILSGLSTEEPLRQEAFWLALELGQVYHATMADVGRVAFPTNALYALADRLVLSRVRQQLGGRLRFIMSGSAPLPASIGAFFQACGIPIVEGYGMTETAPIITINPPERPRFGTVGKPIAGVTVRIAPDGEILCKGPNVMEGYWHKPEATREVLDTEGWFHTGDIGTFDPEGYLRILDRKKELVVMSNGKKVAPQPLENELRQDPLIDQAMICGEGRNYLTALVVPDLPALERWATERDLSFHSTEELVAHPLVRQRVDETIARINSARAPFEQIKRYSLLAREWTPDGGELTLTLKLKRRVIAERYRDRIEGLYAGAQPLVSEKIAVHA